MNQMKNWYLFILIFIFMCSNVVLSFTDEKIAFYREKVKSMFYHAYNGYLENAFPLDELKPLTCSGMDTWGSFSLTLIDALDTLLIMGNETEFKRAVDIVLQQVNVDANVNVSVFETNIRVVGGLLSAHILSGKVKGMSLDHGWPCSGPLLTLAERFVQKLLPAFNTETGMPYGTVNLRYGVNRFETPVTCTAGVGTFILEFGTLSKLTGNPLYERVALKALEGLWKSRSGIGLVGNHINVQTGLWTATDSGIGAGVDSYFEYLVKGGLLFMRPHLLKQFYEYEEAINKHIRKDDWFLWVSMSKAQVTFPYFQSLEAFWPGVLALLGDVDDAARIMLTYNQIVRQYGFAPEFYNLPNQEAVNKRSGYPLRPEIIESLMYLYRATDDPTYLHIGAGIIEAIEHSCKTKCGYATVRDVLDHTLEDRMESFFLSETTKYLYLLFDPENFIHNDGSQARIVDTTSGKCAVEAGGYIFNTEAHPIDPSIIYCCSSKRQSDLELLQKFEDNVSFISLLDLNDPYLFNLDKNITESMLDTEFKELDLFIQKANAEKEMVYHERQWQGEENRSIDYANGGEENSEEDAHHDRSEEKTHSDNLDDVELTWRKTNDEVLEDEENITKNESNESPIGQGVETSEKKSTEKEETFEEENKLPKHLNGVEEILQTFEDKNSRENTEKDDKQSDNEQSDVVENFKEKLSKSIKEYTQNIKKKSEHSSKHFVEAISNTEFIEVKVESKNGGEFYERGEINKQIQEMIAKAKIFDIKAKDYGALESNLAKELNEFLSEIKEEYSSLITASEQLQAAPSIQEIKINVAKRKYVKEMPVGEVLCEINCCMLLDKRGDSIALRRMLNVIYTNHIYKNLGIAFVQGPICWPKNETTIESSYWNIIPDIDLLDTSDQRLDVIDSFAFSTFRYKEIAEEGFNLLTFPARSFASLFTGLGQVFLAKENATREF